MTTQPFPRGTILGYPRIGRRRELKKSVEAFWADRIDSVELETQAATLRRVTRERLAGLGLGRADSSIPESFSYYDQVLDTAVTVGAVPARFLNLLGDDGSADLNAYFTIARGAGDHAPLEMTKWFDSNYHYLVPEIGPDTKFSLHAERIIALFTEAKEQGFTTRPSIVGPVTFLLLAKAADGAPDGFRPFERLGDLIPVYEELLAKLGSAGVEWIQIDEPGLVSESFFESLDQIHAAAATTYDVLGSISGRPSIFVSAPYGELGDALPVLAAAPIEAIGLDLVKGSLPEILDAATGESLASKTLVAGVIDGHNIWRGDLAGAFETLGAVRNLSGNVSVSSSTSLQHVPHDVADEPQLDPRLVSWLAFADQKVAQIVTLARGLSEGRSAIDSELADSSSALDDRASAPGIRVAKVRERLDGLTASDFTRGDYAVRVTAQESLGLPLLPSTTIGSFPQTADIRRARARMTKGEITAAEYQALMEDEIRRVVDLQENIDIDVLVHGEPERNDMVQYFAELLEGFEVTVNGWVQSYGSRCTRPSILWGDVSRAKPMTVAWSTFAQSLTKRHMKGMLTGPVTILAWSFVRDDQPLGDTARQVALALRDEISDLEAAGIRIIQVDEPALRELLPLRRAEQPAYLDWSVGSFKLATAGAAPSTQIHTHLCYSEFGVVIDAIRNLDADVTSIEAARSRMDVVDDIRDSGFDHGIGPGVYDIHSPRVPSEAEVQSLLERAVAEVPIAKLWVNPDCGLKTRGYAETVSSLENMIAATKAVRAKLKN